MENIMNIHEEDAPTITRELSHTFQFSPVRLGLERSYTCGRIRGRKDMSPNAQKQPRGWILGFPGEKDYYPEACAARGYGPWFVVAWRSWPDSVILRYTADIGLFERACVDKCFTVSDDALRNCATVRWMLLDNAFPPFDFIDTAETDRAKPA